MIHCFLKGLQKDYKDRSALHIPLLGHLPPPPPSSYQLAEVVAADLDHLALIPDADHVILHVHFHAGHGRCRHGQPYWIAVHQAGLHLGGLHLLCGQEKSEGPPTLTLDSLSAYRGPGASHAHPSNQGR